MSHRPHRAMLALLVRGAGDAALAACGGSGSGADNPSGSASNIANDAFKFANCMREHGVHVEVTAARAEAHRRQGGRQGTSRLDDGSGSERLQEVQPRGRGEAKLTPAEKVAQEEAVQKFAKCMREHGVHVEAQTSTAGGGFAVRIGIHRHAGEGARRRPEPGKPRLPAAQKACQGLMPRPPGAAKGGLLSAPRTPPPAEPVPKARRQNRSRCQQVAEPMDSPSSTTERSRRIPAGPPRRWEWITRGPCERSGRWRRRLAVGALAALLIAAARDRRGRGARLGLAQPREQRHAACPRARRRRR